MNWPIILRILGILALVLSCFKFPCVLVSAFLKEASFKGLLTSQIIAFLGGVILILLGKKGEPSVGHRDAFLIVTCSWILSALIGSMPYILTGATENFTDAFFEAVSGFTTTGATILSGLESMDRGLHLWRAITQWLGGMGIIVLSVAILPFLGVGGMEIYKAEVPSPVVDKLKPRIQDTAKALWKIYVFLSIFEFALLVAVGLSPFDALYHTFTTMPTGGFSTYDGSIASFNSAKVEVIIIFFMLIAGINFSLHYELLHGKVRALVKNPEFRWFMAITTSLVLITFLSIRQSYESSLDALRDSAFQIVSIITTTGYATKDYDKWPDVARFCVMIAMFLGAMAGSTGGGIKIMRIVLLFKHAFNELRKLIHPHAVSATRLGGKVISQDIISGSLGFFVLYMAIFVMGTGVLCGTGVDLISSMGAVASCLGNVGPGFGIVGPIFTYKEIPVIGKWVLSFLMIVGRLEIMTILVLLSSGFWKR